MCSATGSERRSASLTACRLPVLLFLLAVSPLAAQQDSTDSVPFKIRRADQFLQRRDSTGARTYLLHGDVLITHEATTITCDRLIYYPDAGYFQCTGSVGVSGDERVLACDTLYYHLERGYYRALGGLQWSSRDIRGSGLQGEYWRDRDLFRVTGDAFAADSTRELRSEQMEYDYGSEVLRAEGDVRFTNDESGSSAAATSAIYRSGDQLLVLRGRPVLTYYADDDSLREDAYNLTGDVVTSYGSDSLVSSGRVRLWQDSLTVTADSLFHDRTSDISYFRGGPPVLEHPDYSLSAAELDVISKDRELERIEATGDGRGEFWSGANGSTGAREGEKYVSWIEGDSLRLFFSGGALDSIYATGSSRSYYQESAESGVNYVQGGMILLVFENTLLQVVEVGGGGRGVYLPPDTGGVITAIPDSAGFSVQPDSVSPR
ncbi:MAG: hypothetical protein FVQ81_01540 [Candidatus Glassbacteria bacterium]|nr:hypothetical protein [Candidatus Glassbacteria bacterium]